MIREDNEQRRLKVMWRTIAIISISITLIFSLLTLLGGMMINQEEENTNICYYEICEDSVDAVYYEGICGCYEYNSSGSLILSKKIKVDEYGK